MVVLYFITDVTVLLHNAFFNDIITMEWKYFG